MFTPDDSTAVLTFRSAQPGFPPMLCELPMLPAHLLRDVPAPTCGARRSASRRWGTARSGSSSASPGQRWVFERNEQFPSSLGGPPRIGRLVIAVVDEPTTKFAGLASGDLDFAGIAPGMAELARRDPTMRVLDFPVLQEIGVAVQHPSRAVRRRARAPRRRAYRSIAGESYGRRSRGSGASRAGPVAPESPFALAATDSRGIRAGGFAARRRRLAPRPRADRATRDGKPLAVELLTVGSGDQAVEQLVQADLAARGIVMEIRVLEFGAFLTRARAAPKTFDVLLTGIPGDLSLAYLGAMYDGRQRGSALDYADYHTPRLDSLFARTRDGDDARGAGGGVARRSGRARARGAGRVALSLARPPGDRAPHATAFAWT